MPTNAKPNSMVKEFSMLDTVKTTGDIIKLHTIIEMPTTITTQLGFQEINTSTICQTELYGHENNQLVNKLNLIVLNFQFCFFHD